MFTALSCGIHCLHPASGGQRGQVRCCGCGNWFPDPWNHPTTTPSVTFSYRRGVTHEPGGQFWAEIQSGMVRAA
jgi:hypothetical protein